MGWFTHRTLMLGIGATLLAGSVLTAGTALAATKSTDFDLFVLQLPTAPFGFNGTHDARSRC